MRPCDLRLRHVRIPPGFGTLSHSLHPFTVYDAFSFRGDYVSYLELVLNFSSGLERSFDFLFLSRSFTHCCFQKRT